MDEKKRRMDKVTAHSYADYMCRQFPMILSKMGEPSPLFMGREKEVLAVSECMLKRRMKNCVLVGDAGIGKTEIMKKAIAESGTDDVFVNLDLSCLTAGCTLIGQFEERANNIFKAIADSNRKSEAKICFFIDEIHNLFRVGKSDMHGTMSGGEILKPYLSEGSIIVFGATTKEEYDKYVKSDKALLRRLPPIFVGPEDKETTIRIVRAFAGKEMSKEMARKCVEKSYEIKYLRNPDCSLEIADRAIAKATRAERLVVSEDIDDVVKMMREDAYVG